MPTDRDHNLLWLGGLLSALGGHFAALAVPLLILARTGSPALAGAAGSVAAAVAVAAAVPAGALVDAFERRTVVLLSETGLAAVAVFLCVYATRGAVAVAPVLAAAAVASALGTASSAGASALLRDAVPADRLRLVVSRYQARLGIARVTGPVLGGLLFAVSPAAPFAAQAAAVTASAALLLAVRARSRPAGARTVLRAGELFAGFRFVWRQPFVRTALLVFGVCANACFAAAMLVAVVTSGLRDPSGRTSGLVVTLTGAGLLAGSLLAADGRFHQRPRAGLLAASWTAAVVLPVAAVAPGTPLTGVLLGVCLLVGTVGNVAFVATATLLTPPELLGRVQGAAGLVSSLATPAGPVVGGACLAAFGPQWTFLGLGAVLLVAAVAVTRSAGLRYEPAPLAPAAQGTGGRG